MLGGSTFFTSLTGRLEAHAAMADHQATGAAGLNGKMLRRKPNQTL
jgi:hypothetical protein